MPHDQALVLQVMVCCMQVLDPLFPPPAGQEAPTPLDGFVEIPLLPELAGVLQPRSSGATARASGGTAGSSSGIAAGRAGVGRSASMRKPAAVGSAESVLGRKSSLNVTARS